MPNWCTNNLQVYGSKSEMQKFYDKFEGAVFSFSAFLPLPAQLSNVMSPTKIVSQEEYDNQSGESIRLTEELSNLYKNNFGYDNWYDWQVGNWGTKWDACVSSETKDEDAFHVWFDTAWSPPIEWLKSVHVMFPKLKFELRYEEEGMGFCGMIEAKSCEDCWEREDFDIDYDEDNNIINSIFD